MRYGFALLVAIIALLATGNAWAVSITNLDQEAQRLFVCDEKCGPSFGEDWGSAFDVSLAPGETRIFNCSGQCFIGTFSGEQPPTLGDMAMADDDEVFEGDEAGYIRGGFATHQAN
jgi:hypothetical protein